MRIRAKHSHSACATALLVLSTAFGLSACGGGGQSEPPPQTGAAPAFNWTHEAVRVQDAHDRVLSARSLIDGGVFGLFDGRDAALC